jgi:hypothetical protein
MENNDFRQPEISSTNLFREAVYNSWLMIRFILE